MGPMGRELGVACWKRWKFNPSNRIRPFSVPIHKYPSGVCAIAETDPPGNPLSLPHRSRMYCEIVRLGSTACACQTQHTNVAPAMSHLTSPRLTNLLSRQVFEFFNHNLSLFFQRTL